MRKNLNAVFAPGGWIVAHALLYDESTMEGKRARWSGRTSNPGWVADAAALVRLQLSSATS